MDRYRMDGMRALITGGTSGIGLACCSLLSSLGADVVIVGRDPEKGAAAVASVDSEIKPTFFRADLSDPLECRRAVEFTIEHGGLDYLVNSAGIYSEGDIRSVTLELYESLFKINFGATFWCCRYAVDHFLQKGSGSIVNIASDAAVQGNFYTSLYSASKGAVVAFSRSLALELAPSGIRVNCVSPGDVATPMTAAQLQAEPDPDAALKEMSQHYPMLRIATPSEVAEAVCFLLSERASFITATNLIVDGGLTAC